MSEVVIMPKLGFNMDEGKLVKWHKSEGDSVSSGEVLFEIHTDKTTMEVEAVTDGIVLRLLVEEGEEMPVFTPIAIIGESGENPDEILRKYNEENGIETDEESGEEEIVEETENIEEVVIDTDLKLTPRARRYVKENSLDINSIKNIEGTGFRGGITEKDIKASPIAKKLAHKLGLDISTVEGTGVGGKIVKDDVQRKSNILQEDHTKRVKDTIPYSGVRKIIGDRLSESKFTAPHLYFSNDVDTTNLTKFRKELNENSDLKISSTDLLAYALGKALKKYPEINASLVGDVIEQYESINIGIAVAGNNGLVVPVVKNIQEKTIQDVAKETKDLISRARVGKLLSEEYNGGTFTISNLGMFGIDSFTAIINPPELAILAVSSINKKPVVKTNKDGEDIILIRPMMNMQLSVDHRIIDGLLAAEFLGYVREILENPIKILM
ncbi:2-oxo acid dehydrogenase subunit E2 [Anaerosalibacter massiliensis]|uniref:Dihydrolipoamide acetyltransferase component of pyruvate dehydrogenase complex n=1 Tax=Anaerosalibacter massiliensis TaxID=1347392 RepID=A0A9X2MEA4_9FIRM|nr:dihydrolipoamide acetyltransferase family protein [Anaerosalibacter massiliensis]MCR2043402.1 2-oxo acid dehydrogenase subunit E2 [Anaerosalibacter massiliensis]